MKMFGYTLKSGNEFLVIVKIMVTVWIESSIVIV